VRCATCWESELEMGRGLSCGVALMLAAGLVSGASSAPVRFRSPGGRYEVAFTELEHLRFSAEQMKQNVDNVNHVRYRISFFRTGESEPAAEVEYHDVYGWEPDATPTATANLFKAILWSPQEDFAVLDAEGWASAPGTPERKAVALSTKLRWRTAPFTLDEPVWADALRAIGSSHSDCAYAVLEFDGASGQMRAVMAPDSPIGYEISRIDGRKVEIRQVLDNCRTEEMEKSFTPECLTLDLDTMRTSPSACGKER
jgi:hypothetical protein